MYPWRVWLIRVGEAAEHLYKEPSVSTPTDE